MPLNIVTSLAAEGLRGSTAVYDTEYMINHIFIEFCQCLLKNIFIIIFSSEPQPLPSHEVKCSTKMIMYNRCINKENVAL